MELKRVIEALLFAADKPLTLEQIRLVLKEAKVAAPGIDTEAVASHKEVEIRVAIDALEYDYIEQKSSLTVQEIAGGFQLRTRASFSPWVQQLFSDNKSARLSQPALETLAIIAYRQPITRADIESIRGVAIDGVLATLLDRKLVKVEGRSDLPGRPLLYVTTQKFMEHFCLKNLDELPNVEELRKMDLLPQKNSAPKGMPETLSPEPAEPATAENAQI